MLRSDTDVHGLPGWSRRKAQLRSLLAVQRGVQSRVFSASLSRRASPPTASIPTAKQPSDNHYECSRQLLIVNVIAIALIFLQVPWSKLCLAKTFLRRRFSEVVVQPHLLRRSPLVCSEQTPDHKPSQDSVSNRDPIVRAERWRTWTEDIFHHHDRAMRSSLLVYHQRSGDPAQRRRESYGQSPVS